MALNSFINVSLVTVVRHTGIYMNEFKGSKMTEEVLLMRAPRTSTTEAIIMKAESAYDHFNFLQVTVN
jgi:hypothetical protein